MEDLENREPFASEFARLSTLEQYVLQAILEVVSEIEGVHSSQQLEVKMYEMSKKHGLKKIIGIVMEKVTDIYPQALQKIVDKTEQLAQENKKLLPFNNFIEQLEDEEMEKNLKPFNDFLNNLDDKELN